MSITNDTIAFCDWLLTKKNANSLKITGWPTSAVHILSTGPQHPPLFLLPRVATLSTKPTTMKSYRLKRPLVLQFGNWPLRIFSLNLDITYYQCELSRGKTERYVSDHWRAEIFNSYFSSWPGITTFETWFDAKRKMHLKSEALDEVLVLLPHRRRPVVGPLCNDGNSGEVQIKNIAHVMIWQVSNCCAGKCP